jgi:hypothetical protein
MRGVSSPPASTMVAVTGTAAVGGIRRGIRCRIDGDVKSGLVEAAAGLPVEGE